MQEEPGGWRGPMCDINQWVYQQGQCKARISDVVKAERVVEMKNQDGCLAMGEVSADVLVKEVQLQIQTEMWYIIHPLYGTARSAVQWVVETK